MSFFYDLNKRLANLGEQQKQISESVEKAAAKKSPVQKTLEQALRTDLKSLMEDGTGGQSQSNTLEAKANYSAKKAAAGKDIGKPGKNFAKIAKKSGGGEKGQKIAGAVLAKLRGKNESQLNEYFIEPGDVGQILQLNLFNDLIGENALTTDPEWKQSPKWMAVVKEFKPVALQLANEIRANKDKTLSDEDAEELDGLMYDGSDAYEGPEAGADWLAGAYRRQAETIEQILGNLSESGAGGIHGRMPDPMTAKDQKKKMNPPRSLEEESEEDIMDYLNRKLAPHDKKQAKEGVVGAALGGIAGAAIGGPVGAVRGAMAGNSIGNALSSDQETDEDACAVPYNKGTGHSDAHNGMEFEGEDMNIEETVSRKHFQQVADLLKNIPDEAKRKEMALHHASIFAKQNPRFDIRRFGQAAGVDLEECALWEELKGGQVKLDKNHNGSLDANDFAMLRGDSEVDEGWDDMNAWLAQREKEKGTGNFDKRKVSTGTVYTRKPETFIDDPRDEVAADGVKRGRGRPKLDKPVEKRKTKGAYKHKRDDKLASKSHIWSLGKATEPEEVDEEAAEQGKRHFFDKLAPAAKKVAKVVGAVTKGKKEEVDEKKESTAKKDTNAEKAGKKVAKDIEHDEGNKAKGDNKAEKAGKKVTKDIEYDDKKDKKEKKADKKEEKVDETTTSGSVATASTSSKGAGQVGKGIYDSWNRKYEELLAESVNVSQESTKMEDGNEEEAITIQVSGDDVARFKEVLASMGLGQQGGQSAMTEPAHDDSCGTCGGTPCQCDDQMDCGDTGLPGELEFGEADMEEGNEFSGELAKAKSQHKDEFEVDGKTYPVKEADAPVSQNSPDYPTNQEYDDDALQYAGGLNKPKQTGQSTVPVLASQEDRLHTMEESVDSFLNLYKAFAKTK